jgi:acyl-CoA hydrolase
MRFGEDKHGLGILVARMLQITSRDDPCHPALLVDFRPLPPAKKNIMHYCSTEEAVSLVQSNQRLFIHGGAATPDMLVQALVGRAPELRNVEIAHIHTEGSAAYARPEYAESFRIRSFFIGANLRKYGLQPNVQYTPVFLSEIPSLFRSRRLPLDIAIVQVSPPDQHGFCSLGISVDIAKAATDAADKIIAVVNPQMPRSHGDGQIHISRFAAAVFVDTPIHAISPVPLTPVELAIGQHVASLVEDGATLQMGIGGIPNAALTFLTDHKDLGIHTEMFSDGILPLVEKGVINGKRKKKHPRLFLPLLWEPANSMISSMIIPW